MKRKYVTLLWFWLFLLYQVTLFATVQPITLEHRIKKCSKAVIAKPINFESYWDAKRENIYTSYTFASTAYLKKGHYPIESYFEVIVLGGIVDDEAQISTPHIAFQLGEEYVLFLKDVSADKLRSPSIFLGKKNLPAYELYALAQGVLPKYNQYYIDFFHKHKIEEKDLLSRVKKLTNETATKLNGEIYEPNMVTSNVVHGKMRQSVQQNIIAIRNGNGDQDPIFFAGLIDADNELVIEGFGFGNTPGNIEFPNSNSGGATMITIAYDSDIINWTDNYIRVKIPTAAGSGTINVISSLGTNVGSAEINIGWALNSVYSSFKDFPEKVRQNIKLTNRNELGGYTIQVNNASNFAFSPAADALGRAIDSWVCASGVNWQLDASGTASGFENDGNCVVSFESSLPEGVLAITTSRYKASGNSSCNLHNTVWYLNEFDIQVLLSDALMNNLSWNFSLDEPSNQQLDFESVILHELGHAHGLGHVIGAGEIMQYGVETGTVRRTMTPNAYSACIHKMDMSTEPNCITSQEPMIALDRGCTPVFEETSAGVRIKILLEGFYDSVTDQLKTDRLSADLLPYISPFDGLNSSQSRIVTTFPTNTVDWIMVEVRESSDMNSIVALQPVLLRNDGIVMNIHGDDLIVFEGLEHKDYYVAIHHQSHLSIVSQIPISFNDDPTLFDFSISASSAMGSDQLKLINGKYFMNCGDFDGNGLINNQDFNLWKQANAAVNSYLPTDADGNGIINNQDFNFWKSNGSKISILATGN